MEKNQIIVGVCSSYGSNGEGIVKTEEGVVFVPYLLVGERAQIKILKEKGGIAYGKATEILTPAEDRARPACSVFYQCGGCQLQHMRYRLQLKLKSDTVRESLRKIAGIDCEVPPCERSEREYGYRNKLQLPIGREKGENAVGFYAERSHRIVKTEECPIHPDWAKQVISAVYRFMDKCGLDGYDGESGEGQLRHIVVRELKDKYIVTLVTTVREIKGIDYFVFLLDEIFREYSLYLNYQPQPTNVIFGEEFRLVKGSGVYECTEGGITFEAGANTFVQVNGSVREKLYERIVSVVGENERVIDCYSGGGHLTAMLAKKCAAAYGIEISPEASACAERLKKRNKIKRMQNVCGKVEEELSRLLDVEPQATVVLDPPRAGVDRSVLNELKARGVQKIVMVSCNPATLARDVGILTGSLVQTEQGGLIKSGVGARDYEITLIQPYDMFPQTKWVETLVVLSKKG